MTPLEKPPLNIGFLGLDVVLMVPNKCGVSSIVSALDKAGFKSRVPPHLLLTYGTAIAIMRDPFERFLSCYVGHVGPKRHHENLKYLFPKPVSLLKFAAYVAAHDDKDSDIHFASQMCRFGVDPDRAVMLSELDVWWSQDFAHALNSAGIPVSTKLMRLNQSSNFAPNINPCIYAMVRERFAIDYEWIKALTAWQMPPREKWL